MAPLGPESALTAIATQIRTPSCELHDDRAFPAPIGVSRVIYELPSDTKIIEVANHLGGRCRDDSIVLAICNPFHMLERRFIGQSIQQLDRGPLTFSTHDDVDGSAFAQNLVPMICRMHAAIHDRDVWQIS